MTKFRVWDKEEKHMYYMPAAELYEELFLRADGVLCGIHGGAPYSQPVEMGNRFEVSLSTGLKDCEGQEIYEYDVIARTDDTSIRLIVKFLNGGFKVLYSEDEPDGAHLNMINHSRSEWRIIGNKFQNPCNKNENKDYRIHQKIQGTTMTIEEIQNWRESVTLLINEIELSYYMAGRASILHEQSIDDPRLDSGVRNMRSTETIQCAKKGEIIKEKLINFIDSMIYREERIKQYKEQK